MLKNFLKRALEPWEPAAEGGGPAHEPTPQDTSPPADEPPPTAVSSVEPDAATEAAASEGDDLSLALELHQAGSLPALVDAATAIAARRYEGGPLLILLKGQREDLSLAGGESEPTENLHAEICEALGTDVLRTKLGISGALSAALTENPAVKTMSSLAELLGEALGSHACQQAQARFETEQVVAVRLENMGEALGLAVYLMPRPQADLATVKALADHLAVALVNLRERERARKYGVIDPVRWVYDEERFVQELTREVSRATRYGSKLAVLLLSVVNLERLRAEFGPSQADRLLRAVGATLSRELRAADTLAAYREDGFGLILPETDMDGAVLVANRFKELASQVNIFSSDTPAPEIECAVAAAAFPQDGKSAVELAAAAESRLLGLSWPLPKTGSD